MARGLTSTGERADNTPFARLKSCYYYYHQSPLLIHNKRTVHLTMKTARCIGLTMVVSPMHRANNGDCFVYLTMKTARCIGLTMAIVLIEKYNNAQVNARVIDDNLTFRHT